MYILTLGFQKAIIIINLIWKGSVVAVKIGYELKTTVTTASTIRNRLTMVKYISKQIDIIIVISL